MSLADLLCGVLRPAVCLACGAPGEWPCCPRCLPPEPGDVGPWRLAADPEVAIWTLGPYRDALRAAVLTGKFEGQPAALTELGRRLGAALGAAGVGADLVTFVAAGRVAGRPRDHAERIADGVAGALDLPLAGLLAPAGGRDLGRARRAARPGRTPPRPPPRPRFRLAGGRVLLVDDLATTGGTLAGAAATLRDAGANQVEAATLAVTPTALAAPPPPGGPRSPLPGGPRSPLPGGSRSPWPGGSRAPPPRPCPRDPVGRGRGGPVGRGRRRPGRVPAIWWSRAPPPGRAPDLVGCEAAPGRANATPQVGFRRPSAAVGGRRRPIPARAGRLGRGVPSRPDDRDSPCSARSHCVVVTRFRV
jgi:predicted amidophosphoribosyltransferase